MGSTLMARRKRGDLWRRSGRGPWVEITERKVRAKGVLAKLTHQDLC